MLSPLNRLMNAMLLPHDANEQSQTENDDQQIRQNLMDDRFPHVEIVHGEETRIDACRSSDVDLIAARRNEVDDEVENATIRRQKG